MKKKCPRCGFVFECSHNATCFCVKINLSSTTRKHLKEHYSDCLCEKCLKEISNICDCGGSEDSHKH
ncbi:MAG: cysteine-rich CWC family protein [Bacteroidales bacterium]|nr:cysteine-rich CWC family protein [Bacteroidales bacterium]